ncbi:sensor domain-containing diguanylate cyclase [Vibrio sinaloensis]|uniref:sensor domain-containing diguanylate cyclase n=1 Tax=Photobacterium sp. (strain ATCC 43367) TaxID=379097 RepID=UPI002065E64A|nr:GGDEF domain-containing protein [Vibrio sinaloensis]UPQ87993.1 GGDEF domain-containing protein [Vibrio sinaloensis]
MSLRHILTLVILCSALIPALIVGTGLINDHSQYLHQQKEAKIVNTILGIEKTLTQELQTIINLSAWFSKDRLLIAGTENILFSSLIWQKIESFKKLSGNITATFVLDKEWQPVFENNGSLYHLERSQLLENIKQQTLQFEQGLAYHSKYEEPNLVVEGGQQGVAIVTPLFTYTLRTGAVDEGSVYEPQGYLIVLVSYQQMQALSKPFLFEDESVTFDYIERQTSDNLVVSIDSEQFARPLRLDVTQQFSDITRTQEMIDSRNQLYRNIAVTMLFIVAVALLASRWLVRPIKLLEQLVISYRNGARPEHISKRIKFSEFRMLVALVDSLWLTVRRQVKQLEKRNQDLLFANDQVKESNRKLEEFNLSLERSVKDKTHDLQALLQREEAYQKRLLRLLDFFSQRANINYRAIPTVCNQFLLGLFESESLKVTFDKPEYEALGIKNNQQQTFAYLLGIESLASDQDRLLIQIFLRQLQAWLELEDFARRDKLSNCLNRKAFDEDLEHARIQTKENRWSSLALLIIDINGLKALNDNYGHERGDELIGRVAELLEVQIASHGNVYRLGGDEFAVIVPNCPNLELNQLQQTLIQAQNDQWIELGKGEVYPVHFSIGVSSSESEPIDKLLSYADSDMYRSKRSYYRTQQS